MKPSVVALALILAGCATTPQANAGPSAALGETAYANGLRVRPIAVVEDSRCPIDVVCVWAGRLVVSSEIFGGNWRQIRDLELGKGLRIADGELILVSAQPPKVAGAETDPRAYRFSFDFQGGL